MSWIKTSDRLPPEDQQVLIHDKTDNRIHTGRYIKGRWYIKDSHTGRLRELVHVSHWAWILDSLLTDESDDD
ncbi:MAG TPA: DUF551 domain-containing protein [Pyrinomonadaceae bacterium]|jgi:hypothetical protein